MYFISFSLKKLNELSRNVLYLCIHYQCSWSMFRQNQNGDSFQIFLNKKYNISMHWSHTWKCVSLTCLCRYKFISSTFKQDINHWLIIIVVIVLKNVMGKSFQVFIRFDLSSMYHSQWIRLPLYGMCSRQWHSRPTMIFACVNENALLTYDSCTCNHCIDCKFKLVNFKLFHY